MSAIIVKSKTSSRPASRRQSHRVKKPSAKATHLPTPRPSSSPSPVNSRPTTPVTTKSRNRYLTAPINAVCTAGTATSSLQPTVNWDCVSHVVSEQKIHSTYEKPTVAPGTTQVTAYGRVITTTTTTTVTTTIATTEIIHPGEPGYEESLERQKAHAEASPEERERIEKLYQESRTWSRGDRAGHDSIHHHHRDAKPTKSVSTTA